MENVPLPLPPRPPVRPREATQPWTKVPNRRPAAPNTEIQEDLQRLRPQNSGEFFDMKPNKGDLQPIHQE